MKLNFDVNSEYLVNNPKIYLRIEGLHPQVHAKYLDKKIGFKSSKIEVKLLQKYRAYYRSNDESNKKQHYKGTQTWIGLHPQALQTPYNDIFDVLYILKDFDVNRIVDIGAGYGRVGLVMNAVFPKARFIGFEILKQREIEGNRIFNNYNLDNCEILLQDVLEEDFKLPNAQIYFIYDFSELDDLCRILDMISEKIDSESFFLITKGERIDYLLEKKYKQFWNKNGFLTSGELKIYSSNVDLKKFKLGVKNGNRKSKIL